MQTALSFILVLGVLIFVHELGHLVVAKRCGILCREFAIGFGPKLFSFFRNETLYTIRLLPLGGYVRMAGEDPEVAEIKTGHDIALLLNEQGEVEQLVLNGKKKQNPRAHHINVQRLDLEDALQIEGYDEDEEWRLYKLHPQARLVYDNQEVQIAPRDRQYASKSLAQRTAAISAGPLANFALAIVLFFAIALWDGVPIAEPILGQVEPNTVADEAGLQEGDRVVELNGEQVTDMTQLVNAIQFSPGQQLSFVMERAGETFEVDLVPAVVEDPRGQEEIGQIGFAIPRERNFLTAVQYGFMQTYEIIRLIFMGIGMLITGEMALDEGVAGPIGILDFTGQFAQEGFAPLMNWTAALSVNLAIVNLLPIPALDGGRLVFLGLEAVRGRPLDPQKEGLAHFIGFALIMLLVLVVTWNDIKRVFFNQ
jgi:regulator of sigma E protease